MKKIWVLVADEAIARILEWPQDGNELQSVEELTDPDAHASGSDLQRDAYGRRAAFSSHQMARQNTPHRLGTNASIASSAGEDNQHQEAEGFARQVVQHLTEARQQGRFDELRIVAAPRFLGMLRKYMNNQITPTITEEVNKDLIHMQNREITERLFPRPPAG